MQKKESEKYNVKETQVTISDFENVGSKPQAK